MKAWWGRRSTAAKVTLSVVGGIVVLSALGGALGSEPNDAGSAETRATWLPAGAIEGSFDRECGGPLHDCDDADAADAVKVDRVWCQWRGPDVIVHARVRNTFAANVSVSIVPRYEIANGGQHGTSFASDEEIKVPRQATRLFRANAGHPKGVADGTTISECHPKFQNVALAG